MANPIIADDIPETLDTDFLTASQQTDGTGPTAEVLSPEIEHRNLPV